MSKQVANALERIVRKAVARGWKIAADGECKEIIQQCEGALSAHKPLSQEAADAILRDMEKIVALECGCTVEENTVSLCPKHYGNWRNSLAASEKPQ